MENQTYKLPSSKNLEIIRSQIETKEEFQVLLNYFNEQGFEFIFERSKIFMTFDNTIDNNPNPSLFCIIPSLIPVDLENDPNHTAIGLIAFINDSKFSFLATEVLVNHKPFEIDNYKLHYLTEQKDIDLMFEVNREELKNNDIKELSRRIKDLDIQEGDSLNANIVTEDFNFIIYDSLKEFLNDDYTQHFPAEYKESMLAETSLVEKFSLTIATKHQVAIGNVSYCCSCTCCNGCTTTSTSFSLGLSMVS